MRTQLALGLVLTAAGLLGYVLGTAVPYPGRAFSITAVMIGATLIAIGNAGQTGASR